MGQAVTAKHAKIAKMKTINYETVREIALALPNVEDGLSYAAPALKVGGKLMVRLREDLDAIVVLTTFEERDELMAAEPDDIFHHGSLPQLSIHSGQSCQRYRRRSSRTRPPIIRPRPADKKEISNEVTI